MKLSEFYKERMAANPELTRGKLVDEIGSTTVYAIQHDVPRNFRKSTLQKLAELWKCSIGDIQACLAEIPNPLRKEAEKPEGQAGVIITAKEEKSKKNEVDKLMREKPEETLEEFKARMKDMCLRKFVEQNNDEKAKILIAEKLLNELLEV